MLDNLASILIMVARKLRHYFRGYTIIVLTSHPFKNVLQKSYMLRWLDYIAIKLSEFEIEVVVDLIKEWIGERGWCRW